MFLVANHVFFFIFIMYLYFFDTISFPQRIWIRTEPSTPPPPTFYLLSFLDCTDQINIDLAMFHGPPKLQTFQICRSLKIPWSQSILSSDKSKTRILFAWFVITWYFCAWVVLSVTIEYPNVFLEFLWLVLLLLVRISFDAR